MPPCRHHELGDGRAQHHDGGPVVQAQRYRLGCGAGRVTALRSSADRADRRNRWRAAPLLREPGRGIRADDATWTSAHGTEYGTIYPTKAQLTGSDGGKVSRSSTVTTVRKDEIFIGTNNVSPKSNVGVAPRCVDVVKKSLALSENGRTVRTTPVSIGEKSFETGNGTMLVLSKVPTIRMNSSLVSIFGPEAHDLGPVKRAVQLTPFGTTPMPRPGTRTSSARSTQATAASG
ncbi:L,D-transpeptidase family protein [Streptomyces longwoodensis]|uniref:L,D-transpeptidase family protein n=1 Tax=Streptomyces longwoodensis TaxID=68231 RepID=UPI0033D0534E